MGSSCQIVWKIRQEVTDRQLFRIRGIGTVTGFPMDLGFRMFFPELDFRIRFGFLGRNQVSTGFGSVSSGLLVLSDIGIGLRYSFKG
jgi:hypothetical protein